MNREIVKGKKFSVIGAARSGIAAAQLLSRHGAEVFVSDGRSIAEEVREKLEASGVRFEEGHTDAVLDADVVVKSPGVPESAEVVQKIREAEIPLISEIEVASWFCAAPIVAITGSNGKTTTTNLAEHVFRTAGRDVVAVGNIGRAFSDVADEVKEDSVVVLEVSSFQLDDVDQFRPRVSILLNITPDHLDRYENDFRLYAASKFSIWKNQTHGDACIYNADDRVIMRELEERGRPEGPAWLGISVEREVSEGAFVRDGAIVVRFRQNEEVLMPLEELALRGRHNLYNSLASSMAARFLEVNKEFVRESMRTFEGVSHRLEFVREVNGVRYVNDSKATNVNAVWYALESFEEPVVLIAGGLDKGNDYEEIRELVRQKVKTLIVIGSSAERIAAALANEVSAVERAGSMEEAVWIASKHAVSGDIVLMSPACASFDMFDDYEHRGDVFRSAVTNL
jgi:UDP-N-acetylmuramoylalanine--D-glutamate ligase